MKDFEGAIECFDHAISLNPTEPSYWLNKADSYNSQSNFKQLLECLNKSLELEPSNTEVFYLKAKAEFNLSNFQQAIQSCDYILTKLNNNNNKSNSDVYMLKGKAYLNLEMPDEALKCFENLMQLNSNNPDSYNYIGCAYFDLENYSKSIDYFNQAIDLNPNEPSYHMNKGDAFVYLHKFDEAIKSYSKVIELDPTNNEANTFKAKALNQFKKNDLNNIKIDQFINYWKQTYDIDDSVPSNASNAYVCKGLTLSYEKKFYEALIFYTKATQLDPNNVEANYYKAITYLDLNLYAEALECFKKCCDLENNLNLDYLMNVGNTYVLMEMLNEAELVYKQILEIDPNEKRAISGLGIVYFDLSKFNDALNMFNRLLEIDSTNTLAYNYKGVILFNIYDLNEALECYNNINQSKENNEANENNDIANNSSKYLLEAIDFFDKALELNKYDLNAYICKGVYFINYLFFFFK